MNPEHPCLIRSLPTSITYLPIAGNTGCTLLSGSCTSAISQRKLQALEIHAYCRFLTWRAHVPAMNLATLLCSARPSHLFSITMRQESWVSTNVLGSGEFTFDEVEEAMLDVLGARGGMREVLAIAEGR